MTARKMDAMHCLPEEFSIALLVILQFLKKTKQDFQILHGSQRSVKQDEYSQNRKLMVKIVNGMRVQRSV